MIRRQPTHSNEELTAAITETLDSMYSHASRPALSFTEFQHRASLRESHPYPAVPSRHRHPSRLKHQGRRAGAGLAAVAAAAVFLFAVTWSRPVPSGLAHPHTEGAMTVSTSSGPGISVTPLSSLRPVTADSARRLRIGSAILDGHKVTDWVASLRLRSGGPVTATFVYHLGSAQATQFSAVLPPSESNLTALCTWTVQSGNDAPAVYRTKPASNVHMRLEVAKADTMTIKVTPTQQTTREADCAMTDPVIQTAPVVSTPQPADVSSGPSVQISAVTQASPTISSTATPASTTPTPPAGPTSAPTASSTPSMSPTSASPTPATTPAAGSQ
jgi:hypothetical protein